LGSHLGLPEHRLELLRIAAPMHDVGKIGTPDRILLKPGKLTDDERDAMQRHAEIGHELLSGSKSELLEMAAVIALTHHERFDGSGYPRGLAGQEIPIEGRIVAVADVFDALISDRVYRPAFPLPKALEMMNQGRGTHFDPAVLDVLIENIDAVMLLGGTSDES
jgi:putative two-component system response regulator